MSSHSLFTAVLCDLLLCFFFFFAMFSLLTHFCPSYFFSSTFPSASSLFYSFSVLPRENVLPIALLRSLLLSLFPHFFLSLSSPASSPYLPFFILCSHFYPSSSPLLLFSSPFPSSSPLSFCSSSCSPSSSSPSGSSSSS